jgi:hypothetical protein
MSADLHAFPPAAEILQPDVAGARASWRSRAFAFVCLLAMALGVALGGRVTQRALSDAWIAPLQLSPDNERVVELRIQQTKEKADRARLIAEIAGIDEELTAVDVSLKRLQSLSADYRGALVWSTAAQSKELRDLRQQSSELQSKRQMLSDLLREQEAALTRADGDRAAGLITSAEFDRQAIGTHQLRVALQDCDIELARVEAALSGATLRGEALTSASLQKDPNHHTLSQLSPDVIKSYDDQVRVELEIARLEAEKHSAQARRNATQSELDDMGQLLHELESRPLFRAMQRDTDMAFVPYDHLRRLSVGDDVYSCVWSVFLCRAVGTVTEIVPGEVVTQDPWGELARGQYLVLDMHDRVALFERVLRVRHRVSSLGQ